MLLAHRTGACDVQKPGIQTRFVEQMAAREALDAVLHLELAETNGASGIALDDLLEIQNAVLFLMKPDDVTHISPDR